MEKEKLEQAKKTFAEDSDKFHKYQKDLRDTTKDVQQEYEKAVQDKNTKIAEIKLIESEIISIDMEIKRVEDNLGVCKQRKGFLDELAISAGFKSANKQAGSGGGSLKASNKQVGHASFAKKGAGSNLQKKGGESSGFFMTSVNTKKQDNDDMEDVAEGGNHDSIEDLQRHKQSQEELGSGEDRDLNIYFDKVTLLEHLASLEEDNLFKIHLVQEDEVALEGAKKDIEQTIAAKEREIADVRRNIEMLDHSRAGLVAKQQFLEGNMKLKQAGAQQAHAKGSGEATTTGRDRASASEHHTSHSQNTLDEKSALIMLQQYSGCSIELINTLASKITHILENVLHISHEDKTNKIEMLRKIESELWYFSEKRDYIAGKPKAFQQTLTAEGVDLDQLDNKIDKKRKETRRLNVQTREDAMRREKQEKNDQKKLKQQNLVIFKGRPEMQRARKKDLKPKKKNDEKPCQEIIDQMRYLGLKVYDAG